MAKTNEIYFLLEKIRSSKPLVHHITNWVTIYDCANVTRTIGALPVMAHAFEEAEEMAGMANALVLNIGTLTPSLVRSMISAARKANEKGAPVILDAVGAGATRLRTEKTREILEKARVDIIKGNAGEIGTLAGAKAKVRGVESAGVEGERKEIAGSLARRYKATVVMTGKDDIVTDGSNVYVVSNGHAMMGSVVGTGCMAASVIASFAAVEKDYPKAAAFALACFGIAGELAAKNSRGPGTFKERFYDELYCLDGKTVARMQKVKRMKIRDEKEA
jgi:hydroxyethylthiazole kinase